MAEKTIDLYKAVSMARATKDTDGEFSIKFRKWNRQKKCGGDLCYIPRARCRPAPETGNLENSEHKLFFEDLERKQTMVCWQPLIVEFNGQECTLG